MNKRDYNLSRLFFGWLGVDFGHNLKQIPLDRLIGALSGFCQKDQSILKYVSKAGRWPSGETLEGLLRAEQE